MSRNRSAPISKLVKRLREEAGLTQTQLAERVETTQSVISRLESEEYEGHSLSMLFRIGAALDREIVVSARERELHPSVAEPTPDYRADAWRRIGDTGLTPSEIDRLVAILVDKLGDRGVTRSELEEAVDRARTGQGPDLRHGAFEALRGSIEVGPGDVVADVREARARRGEARRP